MKETQAASLPHLTKIKVAAAAVPLHSNRKKKGVKMCVPLSCKKRETEQEEGKYITHMCAYIYARLRAEKYKFFRTFCLHNST